MEASGQVIAAVALTSWKQPPVAAELEAGWALMSVSSWQLAERSLLQPGIESRSMRLWSSHCADRQYRDKVQRTRDSWGPRGVGKEKIKEQRNNTIVSLLSSLHIGYTICHPLFDVLQFKVYNITY